MFGLNLTELIVVLVIALVVFGPRRLPDIGESLGRAIRNFRTGLRDEGGVLPPPPPPAEEPREPRDGGRAN